MNSKKSQVRQGVVYYLRNTVNGKGYVGQSVDKEARWAAHISDARSSRPGYPLHRALKKYGVDAFTGEVLRTCTIDRLDEVETFFIKKLRTFTGDGGYNLTRGGGGLRGLRHTEATRMKLAERARRQWQDPEERERIHTARLAAGYTVSEATRKQISKTLASTYVAHPEIVAAMVACKTGRKASAETRAKMRAAQQARRVAEVHTLHNDSAYHQARVAVGKKSWETRRAKERAAA